MSRRTHNLSEGNWDKRPYTNRDIAFTVGAAVLACLTIIAFSLTGQVAAQGSAESGQIIFEERCIACHTIGGGITVGPDLEGVTERRDSAWLVRWIVEPDKMLAEGDPIATEMLAEFNNISMPPLGLSPAEAENVLVFLANPGDEVVLASAANTLSQGDPNRGEALFSGAVDLQNGAPACIGCHSATGIGSLGGGTLGPDLTNVHERYGDSGLPTTLQNLPFPTMQGVFDGKPLTDNEVADLYAYFVQINQTTAQTINYTFVVIGLIGCGILILFSQLIWRKRLKAVRQPLLGGAK